MRFYPRCCEAECESTCGGAAFTAYSSSTCTRLRPRAETCRRACTVCLVQVRELELFVAFRSIVSQHEADPRWHDAVEALLPILSDGQNLCPVLKISLKT